MSLVKLYDYVVINVETNGLNPETDDILYISAAKVECDEITEEFFSGIRQTRAISNEVKKLVGITQKDENYLMNKAPSIDEVMQKFFDFVGDFIPISLNVKFDISFINKYFERHNMPQYNTFIDILGFAKEKLPNLPNYRFATICKALNYDVAKDLKGETITMAMVYWTLREWRYDAIFLDIDGVINNEQTIDSFGAQVRIDSSLLERLAEFVKENDLAIILISDWKDYWGKDKLDQSKIGEYLNYRFSCEEIRIADKIEGSSFTRGRNIKNYLIEHKDLDKFVILDDIEFDYIDEGLAKNYIQIDSKKGLTDEDVEKALEILNG